MAWEPFVERTVRSDKDRQLVRQFLSRFDLDYSDDMEISLMWLNSNEVIVATGSLKGEVFRNIAIDDKFQGEGILATVISRLTQEAAERGRFHYFVYTKPDKEPMFTSLGFSLIGMAHPYAILLESGFGSINDYVRDLAEVIGDAPLGRRAAIVMNANPFTLGHRNLIERASAENDSVIVFVVSEDLSVFPAKVRLHLVRQGVMDLKNVFVVPGGDYIISSATFPGYFTKGQATVTAQTNLDLDIFSRHIAPALNICGRYVGEEPYCEVTAQYNKAMAGILPRCGIEVVVVARTTIDSRIISASAVRAAIRNSDWKEISRMVPPSTLEFLRSDEAIPIIEKVRSQISRH